MNRINLDKIFTWCQEENGAFKKLKEFGAFPKVVFCDLCNNEMTFAEENLEWVCKNKISKMKKKQTWCRNKKSVKAASIFNSGNISYKQMLIIVHEWSHYSETRKMSLEASLGSDHTAAHWNAFCSEVAIDFCFANSTQIGKHITLCDHYSQINQ